MKTVPDRVFPGYWPTQGPLPILPRGNGHVTMTGSDVISVYLKFFRADGAATYMLDIFSYFFFMLVLCCFLTWTWNYLRFRDYSKCYSMPIHSKDILTHEKKPVAWRQTSRPMPQQRAGLAVVFTPKKAVWARTMPLFAETASTEKKGTSWSLIRSETM